MLAGKSEIMNIFDLSYVIRYFFSLDAHTLNAMAMNYKYNACFYCV